MATVRAMFTITDTGDLSGRNLLQRSFFTKDPWTGPNKNATGGGFGIYHDKYCLPVFTSWLYSNTGEQNFKNLFPDLTFLEGQQYTFSGKALEDRTDGKHTAQIFRFFYTDGTYDDVRPIPVHGETNAWVDFVFTTAAGKTLQKISDTYGESGYTYFADLKLEIGASATDWTPAPEDMNTVMADAKAAQSTADNAQSTANSAQTAASNAQSAADSAQTDATYAKNEIDGLDVGGRNILKHSEQPYSIIRSYGSSVIHTESNIDVDEWATNSGVRYYGNAGTSVIFGLIGGVTYYIAQKDPHYLNRPYTLSAYVKNLSETSRLRFKVNGTELAEAVEIAPLEQKRVVYVYSNPSTASVVQLTLYVDAAGDPFDFVMWHPQIEYGNRVTEWTPAPDDTDAAIADVDEKADAADTKASTALETATGAVTAINDYIAGNEIVVGTQTAATNAWTGKAGFSELVNGQGIAYWLPYAGTSTAATLKLTLADNSETAAIPVYYKGTTRATTHFTAGTVVHLTYREDANVAGTTVEKGWWADASYDSGNTNYYDRIRLNNTIKAKSAISESHFIVSDDSGYFHLAGGSVFDITKPILWCSTAISAGGTGSDNYISLPSLTLRNNASGITLTANKTCYLVGTLTGKTFTVKSSGFFTSTVPTSDDGYYYISLGYLYSTYQIYLYPEHPIYKFVDGSFKSLNQVAYEASVVADEAKSTAESKNSVYYQATAPTGNLKDGDTWFDTSKNYKISRWDAGEQDWIAAPLGNQAVGNLDASHINTGTLAAVHIEAGKAQDIAGTIKVYDENNAVKVGLDKDGLVATKGKIGGWNITSNSIEFDDGTAPTDSTVIYTDPDTGEELIEEGQPGLVGGRTVLKLCTYDSSDPNAGPQLISATYDSSNATKDYTLRIGSGGLNCYYNWNDGVTGGSVSISPKVVNVINADYDEEQVLWTDSANLNPGSLTILMSKTENGEQTAMSRSFLTHRDLAFIGDTSNPQLASGIAHWSVLSSERTVKDTLKVTVYHCGNLFLAHFDGSIPAGWTSSNTRDVLIPIIADDTDLSNSALVAPPFNLTKYIIPTDLTNMRISVAVRANGRLGISRVAEPFKGNATTTIAGYMETCDIFWAHIG